MSGSEAHGAPPAARRAAWLAACAFAVVALPPAAVAGPTVGGCAVFPANNYWNTRVDHLPVHPSSGAWVATIGTAARLHADWGNVLSDNYGIPFVTVGGSQPLVPIVANPAEDYSDESDPGPYPVPPDAPVEGGPASDGDRHVLVIDTANCILYEIFRAFPLNGGTSWMGSSYAKFPLASNALRPAGWTSADAAGLPIFPGLVRWEEVAAGEIAHAIRFTAANIWGRDAAANQFKYLWPARHWSGTSTVVTRPPMGARFRLKASFDISSYSAPTQVILRAFKKYGLVLADGGSNWFFQGVSDTNWPDDVFSELGSITGSNFEAVDTAPLQVDANSAQARQPAGAATDLDGNGRSDILYRNSSTGQVWRLLMNGPSVAGGAMAFTEANTAWKIVADADFNGDGITDILYRNDSTGAVYYIPFAATGLPAGGALVMTEPNLAWKIVHAPDLDGDGRADILYWNSSTGQVYAMLMNGAAIGTQGFVYTEANTAWKIAAVGDFAGSGKKNQLLWHNAVTGQVYLMTVAVSGGVFSQTGQMIYTEANTAWKIIGAADFNGDGKSDLLWRNESTGMVYLMLMNGAAIAGQGVVYTEPDTAWKIVAQGDYDGDGKADLLWRNDATGQVYMMLMNGLAIAGQGAVYLEANTAWKVLGPREYGLASGLSP